MSEQSTKKQPGGIFTGIGLPWADTPDATRMHSAALAGETSVLTQLLQKKEDEELANTAAEDRFLNNRTTLENGGFTALHQASFHGHLEAVTILLQFGAAPGLKSRSGVSALDCASYDRHLEIAQLLGDAQEDDDDNDVTSSAASGEEEEEVEEEEEETEEFLEQDEESSSDLTESTDVAWIVHLCAQRGFEFFCEVDEDYIDDDFNLTGLSKSFPEYYDDALDLILDVGDLDDPEQQKVKLFKEKKARRKLQQLAQKRNQEQDKQRRQHHDPVSEKGGDNAVGVKGSDQKGDKVAPPEDVGDPEREEEEDFEEVVMDEKQLQEELAQRRLEIESSAEILYGMIHARYIVTAAGLSRMEEKYRHGDFGVCPSVSCNKEYVLPLGRSDMMGESSVTLYCPKCNDLFYPSAKRHQTLDGACWGTTFAHLLILGMRQKQQEVAERIRLLREEMRDTVGR